MAISENMKSAVAEKNIDNIRLLLVARIVTDPNFSSEFPENWDYCIKNAILESDLYEVHDGRPLPNEATNENFSALRGELGTNFSKERLDKIKEIGRKLYPVTEKKPESQTSSRTGGANATHRSTNSSSAKSESGDSGLLIAVGAGILLGAVGGGLIAGLLFKHALAGAVIGAAAGAGAGAAFSKK